MDCEFLDLGQSTPPATNLEMQIVLEYITNIGWSLVTVIVAGQLMVAITDDGLPIIPSIIIVSTMIYTQP